MKVLGVAGPSDSGKTTVVEGLAARLSQCGTVGTVKRLTHEPDIDTDGKDTARHRDAGSAHTVGVTDGGEWFGTGDGWTLPDVLDDFAPECDYVIVEGFSGSHLPKVSLGDRSTASPVVATAADADALDLDEVAAIVKDLASYETPASLVVTLRDSLRPKHYETTATSTIPAAVVASDDGVAAEIEAANRRLRSVDGVCAACVHHQRSLFDGRDDVVHLAVLAEGTVRANEAIGGEIERLVNTG